MVPTHPIRWWLSLAVPALIAVTLCLRFILFSASPPSAPSFDELSPLSSNDFQQAEQDFFTAYHREPNRTDTLSWLGEVKFNRNDWQAAVACFSQIASETPKYGHIARLYEGRALLNLKRPQAAEQNLREFLKLELDHSEQSPVHVAEALFQLEYLLGIELRFEERRTILQGLVDLGAADEVEALNLCFPTLHRWNGSIAATTLEAWWQEDRENLRLSVALGRYRMGQGQLEEARQILEQTLRKHPNSLNTAAAYLECLYEENDWAAMAKVAATLPPAEDRHPWLLLRMRGHLHNHLGEHNSGLDCFDRVLKTNRTDAESWLGRSTALAGSGDREGNQFALKMVEQLSRIQNRIGGALGRPDDPAAFIEIALISERISFYKEAGLVTAAALKHHPDNSQLLAIQARVAAEAKP